MIHDSNSNSVDIMNGFLNLDSEHKNMLHKHLSSDLMLLLNNIINGALIDNNEGGKLDFLSKEIKDIKAAPTNSSFNGIDSKVETPSICKAISDGNLDLVKLLIEKGANVNKINKDGDTLLHGAAFKGHFEIAKLLIEKGAKVDEANKDGFTPLHRATHSGHFEVTKLLVEKGAKLDQVNKDGNAPLHGAARGF